jgi:hypothetical protein
MIRSIIFQPSIFRSDPKTKAQIALSQQQKITFFLKTQVLEHTQESLALKEFV